jgi:hypothetical protein
MELIANIIGSNKFNGLLTFLLLSNVPEKEAIWTG